MELPSTIKLIVKGEPSSDVSNLIFSLVVTSGHKNKYHIHFPKTSSKGIAELTCEDFKGQFEDHWESGLMDYDGTLESANQEAEIELFNKEQFERSLSTDLAWPLLKNEKGKWKSRKEVADHFLSCGNSSCVFVPHIISVVSQICVNVRSKRRG